MQTLGATLADYDLDLLQIIANRWDVDLETSDPKAAAETLAATMLVPENAAHEWSRLQDRERGALQIVLGSHEYKMPLAQFSRLYGELRRMGWERRKREKPHLDPTGMTEILFYRGLLAVSYDQAKTGAQPFVYVPTDLAVVLPAHETGYDLDEPLEFAGELTVYEEEPAHIKKADTTLVDDLTTLLAYLQIDPVVPEDGMVPSTISQALENFFLGELHPARFALLVGLAESAELISINDGVIKPNPSVAKRWLEEARVRQVRSLVQYWQTAATLNELNLVPDIRLEPAGWRNDPRLLRQTIEMFLQSAPPDQWFSVAEMVSLVKIEDPDFQRSDYESWYIRDAEDDQYLNGFENWDRIEGATLQITLTGILHWLGLVDRGEDDGEIFIRLNAYGRAFMGAGVWPDVEDKGASLTLDSDGTLIAARNLSRYSRFQLARFTEWVSVSDQYVYRLSPPGLEQAERQGIRGEHILAFLKRSLTDSIPPNIETLLGGWQESASAPIIIKRMVILQTDTPEMLETILSTPELRRFLGASLGSQAVAVRADQWDELARELQKYGYLAQLDL